jgi:predicted DNA-binding transcriptional regulator YafY
VLKGGSWYLAGLVDGSVRTYRVARVLGCTALDEAFMRPNKFDLAAYWRASTERLEAELHPNQATIRLSPFGMKLFEALSHPYVKARIRIEETADIDGWRVAVLPAGKTLWHAATELLRLGAEAEVLEPSELREKMAELTGAMAARYAAPHRRTATASKR